MTGSGKMSSAIIFTISSSGEVEKEGYMRSVGLVLQNRKVIDRCRLPYAGKKNGVIL